MFTKEQIGGIVRTLAAAVAGWLAGKGYFDAATAEAFAGAVSVIAVAAWSVWAKVKSA